MAGELPEYKAFLERRPCQGPGCGRPPPCVVHHHTGKRGRGQRAHDRWGISLCGECHEAFHRAAGRFRSYGKADRAAWQNRSVLKNWTAWVDTGNPIESVIFEQPEPEMGDVF